nr:MATE family efflux transporter [Shimia biformata]
MTYPEHLRAILRLGLPLIGGHVAQMAIGLTDTVMLGWYSVEALAAVSIGGSFFFVLFIFGSGFAMAAMPLVANAAAQDDATSIRRATRMAMWLSVAFGLIVLPIFLFSGPLLLALGQTEEVSATGQSYLRIAGLGLLPALQVMVFKNYLAGLERTRVVFWVTVIGAVVNAFANYALIFGNWGMPELGARGAAIASVLVQVVSLIGVILYALRVFPDHRLFRRVWRPDVTFLSTVFRLGLPIGLTMLMETGLFAASSVMIGWIGTVPLAAHGIALQITSVFFIIHVGLANVATVRAGNAIGRNDPDHLARGAKAVIALMTVLALAAMVLFFVVPKVMMLPFIDPSEPARDEILAIGATLLMVAGLFHFADAAQVVALGLLRGAQDTRVPMYMAAFSYWVAGMPFAYVLGFPLGMGGVGVWLGLALGLFLAGGLFMWRFWRVILPRIAAGTSSAA